MSIKQLRSLTFPGLSDTYTIPDDWFGTGIALSSNEDLNTYTTDGKYYVKSESIAKTLLNKPAALNENFTMFVFRRTISETCNQLIITLSGKAYCRGTNESGNFQSWTSFTQSAADIGAVPTTRKVNNKALSSDITLNASDVSARPDTWMPSLSDIGALAGYKGSLSETDDPNNLKEDGVWVYPTATYTNSAYKDHFPFANAGVIMCLGANSTTSQRIQIAWRYGEGGHFKMRVLYSGTWKPWDTIYTSGANIELVENVHYGTSLPTAGTKGRIFFKKV